MDKKPNYGKIEYDINELKIQNLIMNFTTINEMIENIDKNMIHDEDISNFKNQFYNYIGVKNMENELIKLDINWIVYKQKDSRPKEHVWTWESSALIWTNLKWLRERTPKEENLDLEEIEEEMI